MEEQTGEDLPRIVHDGSAAVRPHLHLLHHHLHVRGVEEVLERFLDFLEMGLLVQEQEGLRDERGS